MRRKTVGVMENKFRVKVISKSQTREFFCKEGENLLEVLRRNGYAVAAQCGGNGKCGKCGVRVAEGRFVGQEGDTVLACKAQVACDVCVELPNVRGGGLTHFAVSEIRTDGEDGYGAALDIGTTTLAFALVDLKTGEVKDKFGVLNDQRAYGADVLSRISAADRGEGAAMQRSILEQTRAALFRFQKTAGKRLKRLAVCGNTVMLHLFLGKNVHGIGQYPFRAEFLNTVRLVGGDLDLPVDEAVILPSLAAYFGADAVVGGAAVNVRSGVNILADVGTNGEILLSANGKLYATSTAAGPCFEGANIECGTGGVAGAIDRVFEKNGKIECRVIGGGRAEGICGAGLVDAVALMLKKGIVDENGTFTSGEMRFYLTDEVYVSQTDVRNFQLAKSAVCAGIRVLAAKAEVSLHDAEHLYVAGGLGFYLNLENASAVGLFPSELNGKQIVAGNTALAGAIRCLCRAEEIAEAEKIAESAEYEDLSLSPEFLDAYIKNMGFGDR